jgi:hypothetical protein
VAIIVGLELLSLLPQLMPKRRIDRGVSDLRLTINTSRQCGAAGRSALDVDIRSN